MLPVCPKLKMYTGLAPLALRIELLPAPVANRKNESPPVILNVTGDVDVELLKIAPRPLVVP